MDVVRTTETIDRIARFLPIVQNRLGALSSELEGSTGLTHVQVLYLEYLHDTGPSNISQLVRALRKAQSSVSELTMRLEKKGLVTRTRHSDRRKSLVKLTQRGKRFVQLRQKHQRQALFQLLEGLDDQGQAAMMHHLGKLLSITDKVQLNQHLKKSSPVKPILQ